MTLQAGIQAESGAPIKKFKRISVSEIDYLAKSSALSRFFFLVGNDPFLTPSPPLYFFNLSEKYNNIKIFPQAIKDVLANKMRKSDST